jgi:uncharacterized protein YndB with AHSA1/START domain
MEKAAVKPAATDADRTLTMTRVFDAPRERVFDAWLDPAQISKWIGPRTIRAEAKELTPKAGGRYRIHMRREDGGDGPVVSGTYREIKRPERLVFTWMWEAGHPMGDPGHETLITLTFRAVGTKTEMTLRHEFFRSKETRDSHNQGWTASFEKLAEMLEA